MRPLVSEPRSRQISESGTEIREAGWRVLKLGARLLLEYNVRSEVLKQRIERLGEHLGISLMVLVAYREVTLVASGDRDQHVHVQPSSFTAPGPRPRDLQSCSAATSARTRRA
jgi:hypothetical protein